MGNPDGGWFDELPPRIVKTLPENGCTDNSRRKIEIYFDEYIKIDNPNENVIISPPQLEQAEIKSKGKYIQVQLKDSLKENTTYTIDFSNTITDNNEGNPLGSYTYYFSTGGEIDTLEVSGYVLNASNCEAVESILVGLYPVCDSDSVASLFHPVFSKQPMLRVSRTDANGHFTIKGVKEGRYRVYALKDVDSNFMFTPMGGEMLAFNDEVIVPSVFDDFRQDTLMRDSLHIESIKRVKYKHYLPDNIVLRAFNEVRTDRMFIKSERKDPECFLLKFSYGDSELPELRGLNFQADSCFIIDANERRDSIIYWLRDTALVNTDSLEVEMTYNATDTLGNLVSRTDTLMFLPKVTLEKRQKEQKKVFEQWQKEQNKKKKKGEPYDSVMPPKRLELKISNKDNINLEDSVLLEFGCPLQRIDTAGVNLYLKDDTLKIKQKFLLQESADIGIRTYKLLAEWQQGTAYVLELDSAAFTDIYGKVSKPQKIGISVNSEDRIGTLKILTSGLENDSLNLIFQLLDNSEKVVFEAKSTDGVALFPYVEDKDYYLRLVVDRNGNGKWDTGVFADLLQPEEVYYYPDRITCKAKWDITKEWQPTEKPLYLQKPSALRRNKGKTKNKVNNRERNLKRSQELGKPIPDKYKLQQ